MNAKNICELKAEALLILGQELQGLNWKHLPALQPLNESRQTDTFEKRLSSERNETSVIMA